MALLEGVFSVKSSYTKLEHLVLFEDLWREEENGVCQYVEEPVTFKSGSDFLEATT